jgi:spoIIIJ-associated protein
MKVDTKIEITFNKEYNDLDIDLSGEEMGLLIGKRGATLDSIQYLTSLYTNKISDQYVRVKIDTEGYRARRKKTLEHLARNVARKVAKTRRPVYLEPMNPYERRIIHSALQNDRYVVTRSEGEEPYRKVVIVLKDRRR